MSGSAFWRFKQWVKAGESPLARFVRWAVYFRQRASLPGARAVGWLVWQLRAFIRPNWLWLKKFFYAEPLVRYRCTCKGVLIMDGTPPMINGNGEIVLGDRVGLGHRLGFAVGSSTGERAQLIIGDRTRINFETFISAGRSVTIGNDCVISSRVKIMDNTGHPLDPERRHEGIRFDDCRPIVIEDRVSIGADATVYQGVTIGYGSFIGINSVVTRSIPPLSVAVGNPARVVAKIAPDGAAPDMEPEKTPA